MHFNLRFIHNLLERLNVIVLVFYFCLGELFSGQRIRGSNQIKFTIRIYPFSPYELRTQEKCSKLVDELITKLKPIDRNKKTVKQPTKKKKNKPSSRGHVGNILINAYY